MLRHGEQEPVGAITEGENKGTGGKSCERRAEEQEVRGAADVRAGTAEVAAVAGAVWCRACGDVAVPCEKSMGHHWVPAATSESPRFLAEVSESL